MQRHSRLALALTTTVSLLGCGSGGGGEPDAAVVADSKPIVKPLEFEELVSACVRVAACNVARRPRLTDCIENYFNREVLYGWRPLYDPAYSCANAGGSDCKVIRECFGFPGKPVKCDTSFKPRCDGEVAVTCDAVGRADGWELHLDCAKGGLKCAIMTTGTNQTTAACGGGPCNQATDKPKCDISRKFTCRGSGWEINDCPQQGLQCRDPAVQLCEGTGRSCPEGNSICKGQVWSNCVQGYLQDLDCTKQPGRKTCDQQARKCIGAGTECKPGDFLDKCEGDTLVACVDGFLRRFECKKQGFLGCTPIQPFGAFCRGEEVYE